MKEKFCYGCQKYRPESDGAVVRRGKSGRFVCTVCQAKINKSPYKSKEKPSTNAGNVKHD